MELINNVNKTLRDDITSQIKSGSRLSIAASCFSIYAFQELKDVLKDIKELRFIFTSPTFTTDNYLSLSYTIDRYKQYDITSRRQNLNGTSV